MNLQRHEGLEVGLNARTTAGITTADGEGDRWWGRWLLAWGLSWFLGWVLDGLAIQRRPKGGSGGHVLGGRQAVGHRMTES